MTLYEAAIGLTIRIAEALAEAGIIDISDGANPPQIVISAVNLLAIAIATADRGMVEIGD